MNESKAVKTALKSPPVQGKLAVMSYLDDLLHEATSLAEEELISEVLVETA